MTRSAALTPRPVARFRLGTLFAFLFSALLVLSSAPTAQRRGGTPKRNPDAKLERISIPGGPLATPSGELILCADLYLKHPKDVPFLVLFHAGKGSRGEYRKTAIRLNEMGYNCLAVDMRVGGRSDYIRNLTAPQLFQHGVKAALIDVVPDMITTLKYVREHYVEGALVAVGSASSATFSLLVAGEHPELMDGLMLFSPPMGYFEQFEKPKDWARQLAKKVSCPTFLTGLRSSKAELQKVFDALATKEKIFFEPNGKGVHGAKALWPKEPRHPEYWGALVSFLEEHFPFPQAGDADAQEPLPVDEKD